MERLCYDSIIWRLTIKQPWPVSSGASAGPLSPTLANLVTYNLPSLGLGFMFSIVGLYYMKYATDELLISPTLVGLLFGASRIWDAVTDPLAGFLSDRTNSRFGRRRPWLLAGGILVAVCFSLLWYPYAPQGTASSCQTGLICLSLSQRNCNRWMFLWAGQLQTDWETSRNKTRR